MTTIDLIRDGAVQWRSAVVEDLDTQKSEMLIRCVPYDVRVDIGGGIREEFVRGTFARAAAAPTRLSLWRDHGGPIIGRGLSVEDRDDGVLFRAKLGRTQVARDAIMDYEDGIASDPSIEFRPLADHMDIVANRDGTLDLTHRRAVLLGVALVMEGAYAGAGAKVISVREAEEQRKAEAERLRAIEEARNWLAKIKQETR
jgi:phage head maturation protease